MQHQSTSVYLESKPRYEILDGLRGVAAMLVVGYHLFMAYGSHRSEMPFAHVAMAVDFFFMLSGYVIGYAYDDRWDRMGIGGFFKRRLVRLHPMVIMSMVVGMCIFYFTGYDTLIGGHTSHLVDETPWYMLLFIAFLGMLLIPTGKALDIRGWAETYNLNPAVWTLFFEYIANILYALFIRRFSNRVLMVLVAIGSFLTLDMTLNLDVFGIFGERGANCNSVGGGYYLTGLHLYIGFARLIFPFFCGLLLSRMKAGIRVKGGFWVCVTILVVLLMMPYVPGGEIGQVNCMDGVYYSLVILVAFPIIVSLGAGSEVTGRSRSICRWLGDMSYPLYMTHMPFHFLQVKWMTEHPDAPLSTHIFIGIILFCCALFLAYALLKLYDEPVRAWLRRKLWK